MKFLGNGGEGRLQVLGGQSLYGLEESHGIIPTSEDYGARLLRLMGGIAHPSVEFLGRIVGVGNYVANWDVAILNPKGFGEAATISLADCWREGTPVIAGNRFGQRDYMRLFPELAASGPRRISELLAELKNNPESLEKLRTLSRSAYEVLYLRGQESRASWLDLVSRLAENSTLTKLVGLDYGTSTTALKAQVLFDALMVGAQRAASKSLALFRAF